MGGQQGDDSKIAEEAEQAENEERGETANVAKDILGGFDGKLSVEVLENWFK